MYGFPIFPTEASTHARQVDAVYLFLIGLSVFFATLIFALVIYFAVRYRRDALVDRTNAVHDHLKLELTWTLIPLVLALIIFAWGAAIYMNAMQPPGNAMEIYVVGKQWMWKLQHPNGRREINELHIPVGRPVKLTMSSEDVIHSFYVPAFRIKMDVLPGRYTTTWFQATKPGKYHLFCAEYCGTSHSSMTGYVVAMEPADYQRWLSGQTPGMNMAAVGQKVFNQLACATCHRGDAGARGPALEGVYGKKVQMDNGQIVSVDEQYVRESILNPTAKVVAGYQPIMPTFQGQVSEEQLSQLLTYIKSLAKGKKDGAK